jgi:hypothetical protein
MRREVSNGLKAALALMATLTFVIGICFQIDPLQATHITSPPVHNSVVEQLAPPTAPMTAAPTENDKSTPPVKCSSFNVELFIRPQTKNGSAAWTTTVVRAPDDTAPPYGDDDTIGSSAPATSPDAFVQLQAKPTQTGWAVSWNHDAEYTFTITQVIGRRGNSSGRAYPPSKLPIIGKGFDSISVRGVIKGQFYRVKPLMNCVVYQAAS